MKVKNILGVAGSEKLSSLLVGVDGAALGSLATGRERENWGTTFSFSISIPKENLSFFTEVAGGNLLTRLLVF